MTGVTGAIAGKDEKDSSRTNRHRFLERRSKLSELSLPSIKASISAFIGCQLAAHTRVLKTPHLEKADRIEYKTRFNS